MKHQIITLHSLLIIIFLSGCTNSSQNITPSQNSALNSISKSNAGTEKKGAMQKSLDSWLQEDWTPTVSKDKEIQKKYMQEEKSKHFVDKKERNFTLQEYVDKASAYMKAKPNDYNSSNVHKLKSLPVIGK